jgi:hypothetical protein
MRARGPSMALVFLVAGGWSAGCSGAIEGVPRAAGDGAVDAGLDGDDDGAVLDVAVESQGGPGADSSIDDGAYDAGEENASPDVGAPGDGAPGDGEAPIEAGMTSACFDAGTCCVFQQDSTCNDEPSMSALAGRCSPAGWCACNHGFGLDLSSGKCAVITPRSDAALGCYSGCNDDPSSSQTRGACASDGSCWCEPGYEKNPATGLCRVAPEDAGPDAGM